jgi:hypothetical protein
VPHRHLLAAAMAHGTPVPPTLRPRRSVDQRRFARGRSSSGRVGGPGLCSAAWLHTSAKRSRSVFE